MAVLNISRPVRLAIRETFATEFNGALAEACAVFGIDPFTIDFFSPGKNFFDAPLSELESMLEYFEDNPESVPMMCLYGAGSQATGFTHPQIFSGIVQIGGRVFLRFTADDTDFESLTEAVESAIAGIIHNSDDDHWGGGTYRDDLQINSEAILFHNGSFYRAVQFQMSFQI